MKRILVVLLAVIISTSITKAQDTISQFILENSKKVEANRYAKTKGSPFLFQNWVPGRVINFEDQVFLIKEMNYNGHTQEFEIKQGDEYIALQEKSYKQIEIDWKGETFIYNRGIDRARPHTFIRVLYKGTQVKLIKDFVVKSMEQTTRLLTDEAGLKRFIPRHHYYIAKSGALEEVKLKKKSIVKVLGKDIESYTKTNKIDIESEAGLVKALEFYEKKLK